MTDSNIQQIRARRAEFDKQFAALEAKYGIGAVPNAEYNKAWNSTVWIVKEFSSVKTPAPAQLDNLQKQYFTQLIEANPVSDKLKGIIKDLYMESLSL